MILFPTMKMTTLLIAALAVILCVALVACKSRPDGDNANFVQGLLSEVLGDQWNGDVHIDHSNSYFDFTIDGNNVRKDGSGKWVFDSLVIVRKSHWPFWASSGKISFGPAPIAPQRIDNGAIGHELPPQEK